MPLALYFDVHVPQAIAEGLRRRGIDVLTSPEDGTRREDDDQLLQRAKLLERTLITQDKDFLVISAHWLEAGWEFNGVIFAPQDSMKIGKYLEDIELIAHCHTIAEVANRVFYLPLA